MTSFSSWPECLPRAEPIFLTWARASSCQPPKRFHGYRNEGSTLLSAEFPSLPHLPFVDNGESMARVGSSTSPCGTLEGVNDSNVEGCILAACPIGDEDICRSSLAVGKDATSLLDRVSAGITEKLQFYKIGLAFRMFNGHF